MRAASPHFCTPGGHAFRAEEGVALITALIGLALLSLLGLYISMSAANEVRITDNFESHVQARYAALAGLNHARALLKGIDFDDLLPGPDGQHSTTAEYVSAARTFAFRNPLDWSLARFVDSVSPETDLAGMPDDGIFNSGAYASSGGLPLIPATGVAQFDVSGGSTTVRARYFVKVTDNNGDAPELERDPANDPFFDGDGTVVVRSMGIASTIPELAGAAVRRNAVVVYEGRFRRSRVFALDAPLVVQGDDVLPCTEPMFQGLSFLVRGESVAFGIATIDPDTANASLPSSRIRSAVSRDQAGLILGEGVPSIGDITSRVAADPDRSALLDKAKVWEFLASAPRFADNVYQADQDWGSAAIGAYNPGLPLNDPSQRPEVTYVGGNLTISGAVSGAGLLVVKGRLAVTGSLDFSGLVLVIGAGELDLRPSSLDVRGGIYVAHINGEPGVLNWGLPALTVGASSRLHMDGQAIRMAVRLIPAEQRGFREVTVTTDP